MTSLEVVEAIVTAKHKEHLAEVERRKKELEAKHDEELQRAAGEQHAIHQDNRARKASTIDEHC